MTDGMNFWNIEIWSFILIIAVLLTAMLLANMLRRFIKPLRRSLIPSSVLAGFIVLAADRIYEHYAGQTMFSVATLESLTYHGLGLGIVAMALRTNVHQNKRRARRDIFNTSLLTVTTYLLQALGGLVITIGLFYIIGNWAAAGILLPMGYGQGPGQAYNWGIIYQTATDYLPFGHGASFGLSVAAMGFISASIGGILYLNIMRRRGKLRIFAKDAEEMEDLSAEMVTGKDEIPLSESMDKLTVQFGLIFLTYALAFAFMWYISMPLDRLGGFFASTVKPLIWGFNFLTGMLFAVGVKLALKFLKKKGVVKREYTNNFMLNRISGLMFDIMVTASIAAIDLSAFRYREFVLPLILICVAGAAITYFYVRFVSRRLFPDYTDEEFLAMYGMLTGTVSTGLILLREADPLFGTPASANMIYQNIWAIIFGFPMLLLMGFVARSMTWTWITTGLLVLLLFAMEVVLFRRTIFRRRKKKI
ncbi:MAG: hypothetical protein AB7C97_11085 [Oscillospiraceae bacterium]